MKSFTWTQTVLWLRDIEKRNHLNFFPIVPSLFERFSNCIKPIPHSIYPIPSPATDYWALYFNYTTHLSHPMTILQSVCLSQTCGSQGWIAADLEPSNCGPNSFGCNECVDAWLPIISTSLYFAHSLGQWPKMIATKCASIKWRWFIDEAPASTRSESCFEVRWIFGFLRWIFEMDFVDL